MRYLGALFVVASSWIAGGIAAKVVKEYPDSLCSLCRLAEYTLRRICRERAPLSAIFRNFDDPFLEKKGFLAILRSEGDIRELWRCAIEKLPLSEEIRLECLSFGGDLGVLPLYEQQKRLESLRDALLKERDSALKSLPAKQKSVRAVAALAGALAAIVLI
ncbi:MAG: hypothetical protein J5793_02100 [Clostridia bacterium]|nr:hypothetical protein [Clostridia bacterium]